MPPAVNITGVELAAFELDFNSQECIDEFMRLMPLYDEFLPENEK